MHFLWWWLSTTLWSDMDSAALLSSLEVELHVARYFNSSFLVWWASSKSAFLGSNSVDITKTGSELAYSGSNRFIISHFTSGIYWFKSNVELWNSCKWPWSVTRQRYTPESVVYWSPLKRKVYSANGSNRSLFLQASSTLFQISHQSEYPPALLSMLLSPLEDG